MKRKNFFNLRNIVLALGVAVVMIVVIVNAVKAIQGNFSMVHVEIAKNETVVSMIETNAYILRKENYITNESGGVLSYHIEDSGAVEKGGVIANVYESETDAINATNIQNITENIENLRKLNSMSSVVGASLESINKSLNNDIKNFISDTKNNRFTNASKSLNGLLYSMNEKQIITSQVSDFNERIETLQNEKLVMEQSLRPSVGQIVSGIPGVFTSHTDGYEELFDCAQVMNMTYPQLVSLLEANVKQPPQNVIGKIIAQVNWYICCPIAKQDVEKLNDISDVVEIQIPYISTVPISTKLVAVNNDYQTGCAVAIFECKDMNATLSKIRKEKVDIAVKKYSGIKVPKTALYHDTVTRTADNGDGTTKTEEAKVEGVYILHGNELRFKEIVRKYETEEFVICETDITNENFFSDTTVALYDKIVTEGTDLYAGKTISQSAETE